MECGILLKMLAGVGAVILILVSVLTVGGALKCFLAWLLDDEFVEQQVHRMNYYKLEDRLRALENKLNRKKKAR